MSLREDAKGYQEIADDLREQIRSGSFPDGSFLPTERELQARYGVSRSTIRRALTALSESGWAVIKPNRGVAAKIGPSLERGSNVAFVDHAESINQHLFFALSRELLAHGMHLTHIDSRNRGVEGALEYAAENRFSAAFVWSKEGFPKADRIKATQQRMPVIALDHSLRGVPTDLVLQDNLGGASQAVEHLVRNGRRNIAITGMMDMLEINHERFSGYLQALFGCAIQPTPSNFVYCFTSGMKDADTHLLAKRLQDEDRPDAIFLLQDIFAPAVVDTVFACGLRIPEDVALVAFSDDLPVAIDDVQLTTVSVNWKEFAHKAVLQLQRRFDLPRDPFSQVTLPVSLVVRGSCGAPRAEWNSDSSLAESPGAMVRRLHRKYLHLRSEGTDREVVPT